MTNSTLKARLTSIATTLAKAPTSELSTHYAKAMVFCEGLAEGSPIRDRIVSLFGELYKAQGGMLRAVAHGFDVIEHMQNPRPTEIDWQQRRNRVLTLLVETIEQIPDVPIRPDGFTAKELQNQADIKPDLWRQLYRAAGFRLAASDNHRPFSLNDIERLVSAARSHGKRKGESAAQAWEELLAMNRTALQSKP